MAASRSTGLSAAASTNNNNEDDENDDLIDPLLQTQSSFAEELDAVNPRTAASMEAIRLAFLHFCDGHG